jgi:ferrous iron transport protein B
VSRACHGPLGAGLKRPEGEIVIALAGNPNVGKSTLFNALTGLGVSTAHYPGTTREISTATARVGDRIVGVIDLPGSYGLGGLSEEERVARQALLDLAPDVVVVVVDPLNLGRTLYLALEVLDLGFRVVLAVNLIDEAKRAGVAVEVGALGSRLGVPAIETVATGGWAWLKSLRPRGRRVGSRSLRPSPTARTSSPSWNRCLRHVLLPSRSRAV